MDDARIVELIKWGHCYAKPKATPADYLEATRLIQDRPDLWDQIRWTQPGQVPCSAVEQKPQPAPKTNRSPEPVWIDTPTTDDFQIGTGRPAKD